MATRTDDELKEASGHLFYEYDMLRQTARELDALGDIRIRIDGGEALRVRRNALVESFAVHARNLTVFLGWHPSNHDEDVLAKHYVKGFAPKVPDDPWLSELYASACTRIVHLSYARSKVDPLKKDWPIRDIVEAIGDDLERLMKLVAPALQGAQWSTTKREPVFSPSSAYRPNVPTLPPKGVADGLMRPRKPGEF
jgi:hypothetical protein